MTKFFFGTRWSVPLYAQAREIPTPVGESCGWCEGEIVEGDNGTLHPFRDRADTLSIRAVHAECQARGVLGSLAHLSGTCSCGTGEEPDDDGRPWRDQGAEVLDYYLSQPHLFNV